jgi:hypothetical protein
MDLNEYRGTKYIGADDLEGGPQTKTIANIELGQWDRPVLTFTDRSRLTLNATNVNRLIDIFGSANSEDLVDEKIELFTGPVKVQGSEKTIVLVRASEEIPF